MRVLPSLWSNTHEAYLAELYATANQRGRGHGRELITKAIRTARQRNATSAFPITSQDDERAQRLYHATGFRRTEDKAVHSCLPTNEICSSGKVPHFAA